MTKKMIVPLLFTILTTRVFGDCFCWEGGLRTGYRQDQHRYRVSDESVPENTDFRESFNRLRSLQVEAFTTFQLWWIECNLDADWAWVEGGHVDSTIFSEEIFASGERNFKPATFKSDADGDLWDVFGSLGIRFPIYNCNCFCFSFTPLGGYSINYQSLKRRNTHPQSVDLGPFSVNANLVADSALLRADYDKRVKRTFWGPYVGGDISITQKCFYTHFGYSYHFLDFKQTFEIRNTFDFFFPNGNIAENIFINENTFRKSNNPGHRAWLSFGFDLSNCWKFGLRGTYFLVTVKNDKSENLNISSFQFTLPPSPNVTLVETKSKPETKAKWQTFSILIEASYQF